MAFRDIPIKALTLDQAVRRMREIVKMDFQTMTPTDKLKVVSEAHAINAKFRVVEHDCDLTCLVGCFRSSEGGFGSLIND